MDRRLVEPNSNIKAVPPLKTKFKSDFASPSRSIKALITFSTSILSFAFVDFVIASIFSLDAHSTLITHSNLCQFLDFIDDL